MSEIISVNQVRAFPLVIEVNSVANLPLLGSFNIKLDNELYAVYGIVNKQLQVYSLSVKSQVHNAGCVLQVVNKPAIVDKQFPQRTTLMCTGHSYSAYNSTSDFNFSASGNGSGATYSRGHIEQANAIAGQPFQIISNLGINAITSTQILAQLGVILAIKPGTIVIHDISNDVYNGILPGDAETIGTTIYNINIILNTLNDANVNVIHGIDFPRSSEGGSALEDRGKIYNFLKEYTRRNQGVYVYDASDTLIDHTNQTTSQNNTPDPNFFLLEASHRIHLNARGAAVSAKRLAIILKLLQPSPVNYFPSCNTDGISNGDATCLIANPYFSGNGGFIGAGVTGVIPNSSYLQRYNGSAITAVASVVTTDSIKTLFPSVSYQGSLLPALFDDESKVNAVKLVISSAANTTESIGFAMFTGKAIPSQSGPFVFECEVAINITGGTLNRCEIILADNTDVPHCKINSNADAGDFLFETGKYARKFRSRPFFTNNRPASILGAIVQISTSVGATAEAYIRKPSLVKYTGNYY